MFNGFSDFENKYSNLRPNYRLNLESIGFSKGYSKLGIFIESLLEQCRESKTKNNDYRISEIFNDNKENFKNLTGLNIKFKGLKNVINAYASFETYNINHPLFDDVRKEFFKDNMDAMAKKFKEFKDQTYIDLSDGGKVYGFFSEWETNVGIGEDFFKHGFTNKEITSIILHEFGHLFTAFEYSIRCTRTNQLLSELVYYSINKNENNKKILITFIEEELNVKSDKIKKAKNEYEILFLVKDHLKNTNSKDFRNSDYNDASAEQLADQFASRHGYARELAVGLDKMLRMFNYDGRDIKDNFTFYKIEEVINLILKFALFVAGFFIKAPIISAMCLLFLILEFSWTSMELYGFTYDLTGDRFKRIKQELVELIKRNEDTLDKKAVAKVLDDIAVIESIVNRFGLYESYTDKIRLMFSEKARNFKNEYELQKHLEELSQNDLFISSLKLKALT